jgi:hypothetical protein
MNSAPLPAPGDRSPEAADEPIDGAPGLPGLRSWRAVHLLVLAVCVLWIGLLAWLTAAYR